MNILIIGSGGREHALAWQCAKDTNVQTVYVASGNAGSALEPKCENITLDVNDHQAVIAFCESSHIDLVIVGPEAPLVAGLVDDCKQAGIAIWGPSKYCAQLEGSKTFAKEFMIANHIPTARYQGFTKADAAKAYVTEQGAPIVVKADGLAAGKGVIVAETVDEAHAAIDDMLADNKFGDAGSRVVIEQCLTGEEASFICMIDGNNILPMATSQDHKRAFEGDAGPNTGGMGAYSPAPVVTDAVYDKVMQRIIKPVVNAMQAAGHPYTGFLYAGLMIDDAGEPYVIEFNCRFGDPETQPIMMRLQTSLVDLVQQGIEGHLPASAKWDERAALGIVLASKGYPETSSSGDVITGLPDCDPNKQPNKQIDKQAEAQTDNGTVKDTDIKVFHAGTKFANTDEHDTQDTIITNGGRVLCVTALGTDIFDAQQKALATAAAIRFDGAHYRRDIGYRAIER